MTSDFLTEAFLALRGRWKSEDTLQDAFCRLWGGKYKVGSVREAVGLLSRTGRNLEIDEFRKAERHPRQVSIDGRQIEDEGSAAAEREALFRKVEASVDSELTELQKLIVRKHEYEAAILRAHRQRPWNAAGGGPDAHLKSKKDFKGQIQK